MALKYMGEKSDSSLTSAREICEKFNTPFDTMAKVMQSLNNNGVLNSVKGIKGGYSLERELKDLSFKEIENIIEGHIENQCQSKKGFCDLYANCNIKGPIDRLNYHVNYYLSNLTLEELLIDQAQNNHSNSTDKIMESSNE